MLSNKERHDTTLGSNMVQELKINQRRILIDSLEIGIPAPEQMIALGERQLPNGVKVGQLLNSKTLNYKKFTPHRDGLFCERIFGPVQSFVCACGKRKESIQSKNRQKDTAKANLLPDSGISVPETTLLSQTETPFCPKCQVEYISKNVRRHRLGYIKLFAPVTHIWYVKGRPSYVSLFLGKRKKAITSLAYCNAYLVEQAYSDFERSNLLKDTDKSITSLVENGNATIWEDTHSTDLGGKKKFSLDENRSDFVSLSHQRDFSVSVRGRAKPRFSLNQFPTPRKKSVANTEGHLFLQQRKNSIPSFFDLLLQLFPERWKIENDAMLGLRNVSRSLPSLNKRSSSQTSIGVEEKRYLSKSVLGVSVTKNTRYKYVWSRTLEESNFVSPRHNREDIFENDLRKDELSYVSNDPTYCKLDDRTNAIKRGQKNVLKVEKDLSYLHSVQPLRSPYMRDQTLPFLPSLICAFHLRDSLISFLQSLPSGDDIPIPIHCQTPRRYPLRDVHKFLAELRSTNRARKTERLTSESIAKWIGLSKVRERTPQFHSQVANLSSVSSNRNTLNTFITPPTSSNNYRRKIVVHKPNFINLFYQNRLDALRFDRLEQKVYKVKDFTIKRHALSIFDRRNTTDTLDQAFTQMTPISQDKKDTQPEKEGFVPGTWDTTAELALFSRQSSISYPNSRSVFSLYQRLKSKLNNNFVFGFTRIVPKPFFLYTGLSPKPNPIEIKPVPLWRAEIKTKNGESVTLSTNPNSNVSERYSSQKRLFFKKQSLEQTPVTPIRFYESGLSKLNLNTPYLRFNKNNAFYNPLPQLQRNHKTSLHKFTLLPVNVTIPSSLVRQKPVLSFLPWYTKEILEGSPRNAGKTDPQTQNDGLHSQRKRFVHKSHLHLGSYSRSSIWKKQARLAKSWYTLPTARSKSVDILAPEIKISLKGRLLYIFLEMILTGLADLTLPFSVKNNREDRHFRTQRKQSVIETGFEKQITYNGLLHPQKRRSMTTPFDLSKAGNGVVKINKQNPNAVQPQSNQTPSLIGDRHTKALDVLYPTNFLETFFIKSKKRVRYISIPIVSYPGKLRFDKNERSVGKTFCLSPFKQNKYKYRPIALHKVIRKPSVSSIWKQKGVPSNGSNALVKSKILQNSLVAKPYLKSTPSVDVALSLHKNAENRLITDRSNGLFRQKMETYQVRLLNLVFGTLFQDLSLNQLGSTKSSFLHQLSEKRLLKSKVRPSYKTLLLENQIINVNTKSVTRFDFTSALPDHVSRTRYTHNLPEYAYLLRKVQPERKRSKSTVFVSLPSQTDRFGVLHPPERAGDRLLQKGSTSVESGLDTKAVRVHTVLDSKTNSSRRSPFTLSSARLLDRSYSLKGEERFSEKTSFTDLDRDTSLVRSTSGSETILQWHTDGAKEILLYTGGGALASLLKRFNLSLFFQILLSEIEILRKHYKDQIRVEYNTNRRFVDKADFGLKGAITDKNTNLFCRRIYRTTRRLKIVQLLMRSKRRPEWMMISILPVLPPDLRPVLQMGDNLIVASDLNTLYQRVIYRNNRHYKGRFLDFHFVSSIHRLVQDAVDRLIENGKGGSTPFLTPGGRPLKSLSDILKGKRGRFRFNLLGKRVDFSGRSVIVVAPNLKIHECGLPREMGLELYKYLLIRQLLLQKRVSSIVHAKKVIKERKPFIWDILREIIYYHPLLLNRAPTLHRLGIQAFQPKLTLGNAILLHPLVCAGFNADFDGDQMGVHLPLSPQARAEAWDLLWSRNNLLSPATGQPILLPSQEMVLGFYYMTALLPYGTKFVSSLPTTQLPVNGISSSMDTNSNTNAHPSFLDTSLAKGTYHHNRQNILKKTALSRPSTGTIPVVHVFSNRAHVLYAYQNKSIDIHTPIWLKWTGPSENGEKSQRPLEIRLDRFGHKTQIYLTHQRKSKIGKNGNTSFHTFHMRTTVGRVLVHTVIGKSN